MGLVYSRRTLALVGEALGQVGIRETEETLAAKTADYRAIFGEAKSGEIYCMGFIRSLLAAVDKNRRLNLNWIYKSPSCMEVWQRTPASARVNFPDLGAGCLVFWQHYKSGRATDQGHVGLVVKAKSNWVETVEANTASGLAINKEGFGVYQRVRTLSGSDSMKVKGFLRCWDPSR